MQYVTCRNVKNKGDINKSTKAHLCEGKTKKDILSV